MATLESALNMKEEKNKKSLKLTTSELSTYRRLLKKIDASNTIIEIEVYHRQIKRIIERAEVRKENQKSS